MENKYRKLALALVFGLSAMVGFSGCQEDGPAEELGEKVDEAAQDAKRKIEDAAD